MKTIIWAGPGFSLRSLLQLSFLTFQTLLFTSCDPGYTVKYEVVNKSIAPITVEYAFPFSKVDTSTHETINEVTKIDAASSKVIGENHFLGVISMEDDRLDSMYLYRLVVQQGDRITNKDFKIKKYWKLEKTGETSVLYKLIVDSSLFERE